MLIAGGLALAQEDTTSVKKVEVTAIEADDVDSCLGCHDSPKWRHPVKKELLERGPHKDFKCQDCHSSVTGTPHTPDMLEERAACADCHADHQEMLSKSTHANADKVEGDHPTCASCHGSLQVNGELTANHDDPHAVRMVSEFSKEQHAAACSRCHSDRERMERYGVDPDAVPSYEESFHGKALLKFHMKGAAVCTDCHGNHSVLSSKSPKSPTNEANVAATCAKCHPGAKLNFAMAGANHLRLKVKDSPLLKGMEMFFQYLTLITIAVLLVGVALDLRRKVLAEDSSPRSGRAISFLVTMSYLFVVLGVGLAYLKMGQPAAWTAGFGGVVMVLAYTAYLTRRRPKTVEKSEPAQKVYLRFTVAQRIQHALLAISFTFLVVTGMPMRFANVDWLQNIYVPFGGLEPARLAHRIAAVVLIVTWIWHTIELLYRWYKAGFTLKSMTMFPNRKDVRDFADSIQHYFGKKAEEPRYDRFQFREKFDYFAVYWGMPIMVFSGLVLWFPIYFGTVLPELGISAAYIMHSDEAVLAFLAIVLWHFYNTHFNPDSFPLSKVFYTGVKTREEMEREHPLELERWDALEGATATSESAEETPPVEQTESDEGDLESPAVDGPERGQD